MGKDTSLKADDFPVEADDQKLKTRKGEQIATAETGELADQLAERLNEQAHHEDQDRWSA